jgi:hypothetical protein
MQKIFNSKAEMSKKYYNIVITYIRKIRAFLFKEPDQANLTLLSLTPKDIPRQLDTIFKLFEENRDISVGKLGKIQKALDFCLKRLDFKLEQDPKL